MSRRLSLTPRFFAIYGLAQLAGASAFAWPPMLWAWGILSAALLAAAARDRVRLAGPDDFEGEVALPRSPRLGETCELRANFRARNARAAEQSQVEAFAPRSALLHFDKRRSAPMPSRASDGASFCWAFTGQVERLGYERHAALRLSAIGPAGLLRADFELPIAPLEFRVYPARSRVGEQAFARALRAQRLLLGSRLRADSRSADQFKALRDYRYPDPIRHLDARRSARFDRPISRVFEARHESHLVIALDLGRSMQGRIRGSYKLDYYVSAALALAENAMRSRDRVSLVAFSDRIALEVSGTRSLAPFQALFRADRALSPQDAETDFSILSRRLPRLAGSRAIVAVLSDLSRPSVQDQLLRHAPALCSKHLTVAMSLADADLEPEERTLRFFDASSAPAGDGPAFRAAYADLLHAHWSAERLASFRARFARFGGGTLAIDDEAWMEAAIRLYGLLRSSAMA